MIAGIPELDRVSLDAHALRGNDLAVELPESGTVSVDALVTHRFALSETLRAFDLVARYGDGVIKAMIEVHIER